MLSALRRQGTQGVDVAPELHVIGFYEPSRHRHEGHDGSGQINVVVKPSKKPMVVALTAYESVKWNLTFERGANVKAVILSGYRSHTATGIPPHVPLIEMSYADGSQNYFYGYDRKRRGFDKMLETARKVTGLEVLTFQGSYSPLPDTLYRVRPAVRGDYAAARAARSDKRPRLE